MKVLLVSLNPRSKNRFVAEGTLVSRDKTYVVGGNMLGEQYVAVSVCAVSRLGDETLVRPHGKLQTIRDAIGHVIAWPLSHVSTLPCNHCMLKCAYLRLFIYEGSLWFLGKKTKINHFCTTSKQATKDWYGTSSKYISSHTSLKAMF